MYITQIDVKSGVIMKKKHNRMSNGKKIFLLVIMLILLAVLLVVAFLLSKLDLIQYDYEMDKSAYYTEPAVFDETHDVSSDDVEQIVDISGLELVKTVPPIPESEVFEDSDVMNILLIGTDERSSEFSTNARSDSMILVSIDKEENTVKLVSLERGIAAPILEGQYAGQYDWLTHVFRYGGADLLTKTVEYCFKIDIDHYVRVNFNSVTEVIDAIGGIDIELTKSEVDYMGLFVDKTTSTGKQAALKVGMNRLDGGTALAYARLREIDSDWQRVGRQRKVILAAVERLKGSGLMELNDLADTVLPLIQTNLTKLEIAELILYAPNFLSASFDQMTIPKQGTYGGMTVMGGRGSFAIDFEVNNDLLHRFLYEGATSEELLAE